MAKSIKYRVLLITAGVAGFVLAAPFAAAQSQAPKGTSSATKAEINRPLVPVPQVRKRKRPRLRMTQPKGKKVKTAKRRKARRAPEDILKPPALPWDEQIKRFRERSRILGPDPQERLRLALRELNADPMLRLGYTANIPATPAIEAPQPVVPPVFEFYSEMDKDGDGNISRQEYIGARSRIVSAGPAGDTRRRSHMARLKSRFRGVDSNNDGRISPEELEGLRNLRF